MLFFGKKRHKQQDAAGRRRQPAETQESRDNLEQRYAFKRNRTITGSASSSVFSANESAADLKSPRVQAHELVRKRRHVGVTLFVIVIMAGGLFWLITQFTAVITVKAAEDSSVQLASVYAEAIEDYYSQHPIERLRFILDEGRLTQHVQASAPEVKGLAVEDGKVSPGQTTFAIAMRVPIAGWTIKDKQRFVDETGVAFVRNYFSSPAIQIVDKSGIEVDEGSAVASNRFLGFVGQVAGLVKARNYIVTEVAIPASVTRQVEVRIKGIGYPIKFSIDRSAGEQVEDMVRTIEWFAKRAEQPEYVDVRVSRRVFYR